MESILKITVNKKITISGKCGKQSQALHLELGDLRLQNTSHFAHLFQIGGYTPEAHFQPFSLRQAGLKPQHCW